LCLVSNVCSLIDVMKGAEVSMQMTFSCICLKVFGNHIVRSRYVAFKLDWKLRAGLDIRYRYCKTGIPRGRIVTQVINFFADDFQFSRKQNSNSAVLFINWKAMKSNADGTFWMSSWFNSVSAYHYQYKIKLRALTVAERKYKLAEILKWTE
jgi:hypothetical protein